MDQNNINLNTQNLEKIERMYSKIPKLLHNTYHVMHLALQNPTHFET
jgi:hypothetical protein